MTYDSTFLALTPDMYWKTQDTSGSTLADATGNAKPGTLAGTFALLQAGMIANDAASKSVHLSRVSGTKITSAVTPFSGSKTFVCWFNRDDHAVADRLFLSSAGTTHMLFTTGNSVDWYPNTGDTVTDWASAISGLDATNVLLILAHNESAHQATLWINGTKLATKATAAYAGAAAASTFQIGDTLGAKLGNIGTIPGIISDANALALWNAAQSVTGQPRIGVGAVQKPLEAYIAGSFTTKPAQHWNGSAWVNVT